MPERLWVVAPLESLPMSLAAIVVAAIVYAVREPLRKYELKRDLKLGGLRPSLVLLALLSVSVGIALALLARLLYVLLPAPPLPKIGTAALTRAMAPIMLMISLPFITTAIMLVGEHTYVRRLREGFPSPIYCDARRMCEVVLDSLSATYFAPRPVNVEKKDPEEGDAPSLRAPTNLEIESVSRNRATGLDLLVREHVTTWEADQKGTKFTVKPDDKLYDVSTDEWAHITHFEPHKQKIRLSIYEPDVKMGR